MLLGDWEHGRGWKLDLHTPKWTPTLGVGVSTDSRIFKNDCRGQNPFDWRVPYIIGNILEHRCLKWACMTHLDIWNTSYGQKKGWESSWQFDSRPLKVGNRLDSLAFKWRETYHWKALDKGYNFALDHISIGGLHKKLCAAKVENFGTPIWESQDKMSFGCQSHGQA
jgi:hypothetical protein